MRSYRMVEDQASIGIEPITAETAQVSNGTYHGRVFVVQSCRNEVGDGWEFEAAFRNPSLATKFLNTFDVS